MQRTFSPCTRAIKGGICRKKGMVHVLEGEVHVTVSRSFIPQTSPQQGCRKLQETKSTLGVESLGVLESLFSLVMDMIRVALNKSFFFFF